MFRPRFVCYRPCCTTYPNRIPAFQFAAQGVPLRPHGAMHLMVLLQTYWACRQSI